MALDPRIARLVDEAAAVLAGFLTESETAISIPRGWTDDFHGGVEKSVTHGTSSFRIAIGFDDDNGNSSSNYDDPDDELPASRPVYFAFSRSALYSTSEDPDEEGFSVSIDENGRVVSVEDWFPSDSDECYSLLNRTKLAPILREGTRLVPVPWKRS